MNVYPRWTQVVSDVPRQKKKKKKKSERARCTQVENQSRNYGAGRHSGVVGDPASPRRIELNEVVKTIAGRKRIVKWTANILASSEPAGGAPTVRRAIDPAQLQPQGRCRREAVKAARHWGAGVGRLLPKAAEEASVVLWTLTGDRASIKAGENRLNDYRLPAVAF